MRYVPDANTPYAKVAGDAFAIDHVQSAAEVLKRRAGDCADLTALFCSLREGAGISTALGTSSRSSIRAWRAGSLTNCRWIRVSI